MVRAAWSSKRKPKKIIVNEVKSLRETRRESIAAIHIKLDPVGIDEDLLAQIKRVIVENRGGCPVFFHIRESRGEEKIVRAHHTYGITPSDSFMSGLVKIVGGKPFLFNAQLRNGGTASGSGANAEFFQRLYPSIFQDFRFSPLTASRCFRSPPVVPERLPSAAAVDASSHSPCI